jgi:hypothetical protein
MTKEEYAHYLQGSRWRELSRVVRQFRKVCERCAFPYELNVHHKTYERIGQENMSDLIVLCRACHSREHFAEDIDSYPEFLLEGDSKSATLNRLRRQQNEARAKNIQRKDELQKNRERDEDC